MKEVHEIRAEHAQTDWCTLPVISLQDIWPALLPKLRADAAFNTLACDCAEHLSATRSRSTKPNTNRKPWTSERLWREGLFLLSWSSDYWIGGAHLRMKKWLIDDFDNDNEEEKDAVFDAMCAVYTDEDDAETRQVLKDAERRFWPKPDQPAFLQAGGRCHAVALMAARAAQLLQPSAQVTILRGVPHSTVVISRSDGSGGAVFDWLYDETWLLHPVEFAQMTLAEADERRQQELLGSGWEKETAR